MGMSMHVTGFVPPDETWTRMKAIWDACEAASIPVPREVDDFFDGETPDPAGQTVEIPCREWRDDSRDGREVVLSEIPANVKIIRFYCAW